MRTLTTFMLAAMVSANAPAPPAPAPKEKPQPAQQSAGAPATKVEHANDVKTAETSGVGRVREQRPCIKDCPH
jgi:hypothetical protein